MRMIWRTLRSSLRSSSGPNHERLSPSMTTYQHTLTVGDGEYLALSDALKLMIEHCEAQMKAGEGAPTMHIVSTATRCLTGSEQRPH